MGLGPVIGTPGRAEPGRLVAFEPGGCLATEASVSGIVSSNAESGIDERWARVK
jgi:hypothetical protein